MIKHIPLLSVRRRYERRAARSEDTVFGLLFKDRRVQLLPRCCVCQVAAGIGSQQSDAIIRGPTSTCTVVYQHFVLVSRLKELWGFVDVDRIGRFTAVGRNPLTFPFILRFRNHHPVRRECPWILHFGYVDALGFGLDPSFGPSAPDEVAFTPVLKRTGMDCPVIVFVRFDPPFHHELTLQRVG